jgi:hypothetical protein
LPWSLAGLGLGFLAGLLLGERMHHREVARARMQHLTGERPARLSAAATARAAANVLDADPMLKDSDLRTRGLSAGVVELSGWVAARSDRTRATRVVQAIPGVDTVVNRILVHGEDDLPPAPDLRLADQSA